MPPRPSSNVIQHNIAARLSSLDCSGSSLVLDNRNAQGHRAWVMGRRDELILVRTGELFTCLFNHHNAPPRDESPCP